MKTLLFIGFVVGIFNLISSKNIFMKLAIVLYLVFISLVFLGAVVKDIETNKVCNDNNGTMVGNYCVDNNSLIKNSTK